MVMKMILKLADTSIRIYSRKDSNLSYKLRSYLMVESKKSFKLNTYLREISAYLILSGGQRINFDEIAISDEIIFDYQSEFMVHDFWASAISNIGKFKNGLGKFRLDYRIDFTDFGNTLAGYFEANVPLIRRIQRYIP